MSDLEVQRSISKGGATFYAFATPDAQGLVDRVFKKGLFYILSVDGSCWAQLVLSSGIHLDGAGFQVAPTKVTVSAKIVGVHTFDG